MYLEKETYSSGSSSYESISSVKSSFVPFDLPALIENLKQDRSWEKGEINSLILLKSPIKKVVLAILHEGAEIISFQENDSITFQILEGKIKLHIRQETIILNQGELLTLREKTKYRIDTIEESALLLTLASKI